MLTSKAAKRYAKAFFDIASEQGCLEEVRADFQALATVVAESVELQGILQAPLVKADKKAEVIKTVFEGKVNKTTLEFVLFLNSKDRVDILADVATVFEDLYYQKINKVKVSITAAFEMAETEVSAICARLKDKLGQDIEAEVMIDPELIGGFKVRVADSVYDLSIKTQLETLKQSIVNS